MWSALFTINKPLCVAFSRAFWEVLKVENQRLSSNTSQGVMLLLRSLTVSTDSNKRGTALSLKIL